MSTRQARRALGVESELVLGVNRSDYMLDEPSGGFLQVGGGSNEGDSGVIRLQSFA